MKTKIFLFLGILFLFVPFSVGAYYEETHAYLTEKIFDLYNNESKEKIAEDLKPFFVDGSRREDDAPRWMNHFYDPVKNRGLSYDPLIDPAVNIGSWQKSKDWVNDEKKQNSAEYKVPATIASILTAIQKMKLSEISSETNFTWDQAMRFYLRGDKEKAMFLLGHIVHLLEDTSVPDHTRNDPHANDSPYEDFTKKFTISNPDSRFSARIAGKNTIKLDSLQAYFDSLATYSNKNFYSKDTIGIQSGYSDPEPTIFSLIDGKNYGLKSDNESGDFPITRINGLVSFKNNYFLDDLVLNNYWDRLSTKSVQYGEGLLELFFKEAEKKRSDTAFWQESKTSLFASLLSSFKSNMANFGEVARNFLFGIPGFYQKNSSIDFGELENEILGNTSINLSQQERKMISSFNLTPTELIPTSSLLLVSTSSLPTSTLKVVLNTTTTKETKENISPIVSSSSLPNVGKIFRLRINEIMFDVLGSDEGREWIEIYHEGGDEVDLTELSLFENRTNHRIEGFHGSRIISDGEYVIFSSNPEMFLVDHPNFSGKIFKSSFSLSNAGELIELRNESNVLSSNLYSSGLGANGDGKSLQYFSTGWEASSPTPASVNVKSSGGGEMGNQLPQAIFSFSPQNPKKGELIDFSAANSSDSDGKIEKFYWDFGDGNEFISTSSPSTSHAYFSTGEKTVKLTVFDNKGASGSISRNVTVENSTDTVSQVSHVVISEIFPNPDGSDAGKEFVELYNPTTEQKNLDAWTLKYVSTEKESSLAVFNDSNDRIVIPPHGFLLIGLNSYDSQNYSGREADIRRSASLPNGSENIQIKLYDETDALVDTFDYSSSTILEGKSFEREGLLDGLCVSPSGEGEFLGNGCDTDSGENFEIRNNPLPQNSENLSEPRDRLSTPIPENGKVNIVSYDKENISLAFSWSPVTSSFGVVPHYRIKQKGGDIVFPDITTFSTSTATSISEVGRVYSFEITAEDQEGYQSLSSEYSISIPSFIDVLRAFPDPRVGHEGKYAFELYYDDFPFIKKNGPWHGLVFYRNRDANKMNLTLSTPNDFRVADSEGVIRTAYTSCTGFMQAYGSDAIIFPTSQDFCGVGGGLHSSSLSWSFLEDKHLLINSYDSDLSFSPGDYFTIGFYSFSESGGGSQSLSIVAVDKTHYPLLTGPIGQSSPELQNVPNISFDGSFKIDLEIPSAKDSDSIDQELIFETNYSPKSAGVIDDKLWSISEKSKVVSSGDSFIIGVRSRDDFGNYSGVAITEWEYPSTTMYITQGVGDDWSRLFGTRDSYIPPSSHTAIFQSISPEEDYYFDTVSTKLWSRVFADGANVRLNIYPGPDGGMPDFSTILGSKIISLSKTDAEKERTFFFDSPILFEKDKTYWLMIDVLGYDDSRGYWRNEWVGTASASDTYNRGQLGYGVFDGGASYISGLESKDLYFRLGRRN